MVGMARAMVLDGLGNGCGITTAFNEHEEGHASLLTGRIPFEVPGALGRVDGPSIDQVIAEVQNTPLPSLEWSFYGWSVTFDQQGQALPYEIDPWAGYDRVFPNGQPTQGPPSLPERIRSRQGSMLDLVGDRFAELAQRLSGEDRIKLETHRDLIRDLESRLEILAGLECEQSPRPEDPYPNVMWDDAAFPTVISQQWQQLIAVALSCGLTNVITYRMDSVNNGTIGAPPGDIHSDYAHEVPDSQQARDVMTDYHTWHAERLAELLELLDTIPEGGGTMLDNTIVVWCNELSTGDHTFPDMPVLIAGGTDFFDQGRYVRWGGKTEMQGPWDDRTPIGQPHNKLLTTLGQSMGLNIDSFGVTSLQQANGGQMDCTGILDRVCL